MLKERKGDVDMRRDPGLAATRASLTDQLCEMRRADRAEEMQHSDAVPVADVARTLGLGLNTTYRYLLRGIIPATKVGGRYVVSRDTLKKILLQD